ncbi:riboflavin kinase [Amycolatopsis sp. NPDC003861]
MSVVIEGVVEHGDARGRLLGFPTANLRLPGGPEHDGVWTARVLVPGEGSWPATVSVGTRPTYYDTGAVRLAEAHLLGFDGDLYERTIRVELLHRLRGQVTCASSAELVALIRDDVARTRAQLIEPAHN